MQKKLFGAILALCLLLGMLMALPAAAADVIELSTPEQILKLMNEDSEYPLDGNYKVVNDIDLSEYTGNLKQNPIGTAPSSGTASDGCFSGTFDGGNYTISGLKINTTSSYTGFFGCAGCGAEIKNVQLKGTVDTTANASGALIGYGRNDLTVVNCTTDVTVNGAARAAGIIGGYDSYVADNSLRIIGCTNKGAITGTGEQPAGIVGRIVNNGSGFELQIIGCTNEGTIGTKSYASGIMASYTGKAAATVEIKNCVNSGAITGNSYSAGIAGNVNAAAADVNVTIQDCINEAPINSPAFVGGIGGRIETSKAGASIVIKNCQNYAKITSSTAGSYVFSGGIAGMVTATYGPITVSQCYNEGTITGYTSKEVAIGGIVGYARSMKTAKLVEISDCWNAGVVTSAPLDTAPEKYGYIGGVVGGFPTTASANGAMTAIVTNCVNTGTVSEVDGLVGGGVIGYSAIADSDGLATTYTKSGDTWTTGTGVTAETITGLSDSVWTNATTNPTLTHQHVWVASSDGKHLCATCSAASEDHNYVSLSTGDSFHMCEDCGYSESHTWSSDATTHTCQTCEVSVEHSWVSVDADNHKCAVCEKTGTHSYKDYACEDCSQDQPAIELTVTALCAVPGVEGCTLSGKLDSADVQVDFDKITVAKDGENWVASGLQLTGNDADHYKLTSTTFVMENVPADHLTTITVVGGTASQTEIYRGQSYSVTVTADSPAKGYRFAGWLLDDATEPISTSSTYTMQRVATNDITLTATYELAPDDEPENEGSSNNNLALAIALACRNNKKCVVTYKSTGANDHVSVTVKRGTALAMPVAPTKDGYTFVGWYKDINGTKPFDFNAKITGSVSIYAKWVKN